ncbi:MAG: YkgJ family cysteine cluster protein [Thiohalocapsa sp.]|nr:YkgJ family cysteine cluster protein [Thiohalocapsa sp.]MCF7991913.1 YkgJ family cysteine cluster protein [Thiohalocapsa sp.]
MEAIQVSVIAVSPQVLDADSRIRFRCHKGISCFNACCEQADVTLAPYDVIRLKRRLGMTSTDFLAKYTVPFQMDMDGTPGIKLRTDDSGTCLQLNGDAGCGVYEDRPTVCRYYPLGLLSLREKGSPEATEQFSLVKEEHCRGHLEDRTLAIGEYRGEQEIAGYDAMNRDWYRLILKKKSAGPTVGRPPEQSLQLFFMASYDLDRFRRFVLSESFKTTYPLGPDYVAALERSDEDLLLFAYRFLRQVLFGEHSIREAADAWEKRVAGRKAVWDARREIEIARRAAAEDEKYRDEPDPGDTPCRER